jgi:hypothetical protein
MRRRVTPTILLLVACHAPTSLPYHEQLVVNAYLFAGQPVSDIELTGTLPLTSPDSVGPPISDAMVSLTKRGVRYVLSADPSRAGFYRYTGTDLTVGVADTFDLTVIDGGDTATATAVVPPPPTGLSLSATQLSIDSVGFADTGTLTVRWSNPDTNYFFAVITALDPSAGKIPVPGSGSGDFVSGSVTLAPTQADSTIIARPQLEYYGPQRVVLYRVPPQYAALYIARQQDSRDLNEPPTNIHGGLGIFSAFAGDSVFFDVIGG